jgi:hypothetical protein
VAWQDNVFRIRKFQAGAIHPDVATLVSEAPATTYEGAVRRLGEQGTARGVNKLHLLVHSCLYDAPRFRKADFIGYVIRTASLLSVVDDVKMKREAVRVSCGHRLTPIRSSPLSCDDALCRAQAKSREQARRAAVVGDADDAGAAFGDIDDAGAVLDGVDDAGAVLDGVDDVVAVPVAVADNRRGTRARDQHAAAFGYTPPPSNDGELNVVCVDPGESPFLSLYAPATGWYCHVGQGDRSLLLQLLRNVDRLDAVIGSADVKCAQRRILVKQVRCLLSPHHPAHPCSPL